MSFLPFNKIKELKKENSDLKEKLLQKQEHIDKTNAFWKKKLYQITRKRPH